MGRRDTVAVPVMDLAIGQVYGEKYRILRLLGQGSMGAVYEGENVRIHRKVAIKTLHQGMAEKGDTLQRFEREAQAAGRIGSKHICEVLDMGDLPDGSRYMVMEHLEGVTLQQHIRSSGRLKPTEASPIVQQLLDGLGAAHAAGIIHRDLKPANVFLLRQPGRADFVKILDFGVSKFSVLSEEMSMTRTGAVLGTPYYMSPEQAKGSRGTDARSDLYAVGVILYECITGQVPFSAETFNELLFRIVLEMPPPAESFVPDLSPEFAAIIRKAMAREPADRYQTAQEFKQVLADWSAKADEDLSGEMQTVMRTAPAALRAAPPSITAQGTVMVDRGAPQPAAGKQGLAAQGTVIIDPAVAGPSGGAQAPAAQGSRYTGPTQPIPQWTGPTPGIPGPPVQPTLQSAQAQQGAQAQAPYPAPYPQPARDPYNSQVGSGPYGFAQPGEAPPASQLAARKSPMRMIAFLGIAVGLLAGVAAWAVLWRDGGAPSDAAQGADPAVTATATTAAPTATAASTTGAPSTASSADVAPTAAPTTSASAEPIPTAAEPAVASAPSGGSKGSSTSGPKAAASGTASGKAGGKNPKGGRTVSSDL